MDGKGGGETLNHFYHISCSDVESSKREVAARHLKVDA